MKTENNVNLFDVFVSSIISMGLTYLVYKILYPVAGYNFLDDFYTGDSVFDNHNKYLDLAIYFIYIFIAFAILPLFAFVKKYIPEFSFSEIFQKFKNKLLHFLESFLSNNFLKKSKEILYKYQFLGAFGYILLHPFDGVFYPKIFLIVLFLVSISLFDGIRRIKSNGGTYSPLCLAGFLFILFFTPYSQILASSDSHHMGERFATYFMIDKFNLRPYKDIMLVHGFSDIIPSYLGKTLFDNFTLEGFMAGETFVNNIITILFFVLGFSVFSKAPYLLLFFFLFPVSSFSVFLLSYLFLISENMRKRPFALLFYYIILAFFFSAYWTTLGTFWVVSSLPSVIYVYCFRLKEKDSCKFLKLFLIFLFAAGIIYFARDLFFYYSLNAKEYIKGNLYGFGNGFGFYTNLFLYLTKCFALFIFPCLLYEFISFFKNKNKDEEYFFFLLFALILPFVSLNYTFGRIDFECLARAATLSYPVISVFVPYYIYKKYRENKILKTLFVILFIVFSFNYFFKKTIKNFKNIKRPQIEVCKDFKNTGKVIFKDKFKEKIGEQKELIEKYSNQNSTFFDLTNSGMNYLYFDKKIPVLYVSYLNQITTNQIKESAQRLALNPPDVILLGRSAVPFRGINPSVRINEVYRQILLGKNYKLKRSKTSAILVKTEKPHTMTYEELFYLDNVLSCKNFAHLSEAWAYSVKTLPVLEINLNYNIKVEPKTVTVKFKKPVKGSDIDLLYLEPEFLNTIYNKKYKIEINGSKSFISCDSKKGNILVPFDNYPTWLMNDNIREIKITLKNKGNLYKDAKVKFYKRNN